ncbi:unnamed protein product [Nezara viridula]|uniref:Neuropeptide n=1 Tax=Nezara viridula TaxID=85310 RepID=A0A9P0HTZ1_NEZVI|nr:unnamed protein product [Nezara viridula]
MKYSLHFLLILCAVEGYRGQRPYQCGARPCSPEFNPVCGWKLSEEGETIDKMFPNVCVMGEENDCNENDSHHWILYDTCPSQIAMDKESLKVKYQKENEKDEEDFRKWLDDLVE